MEIYGGMKCQKSLQTVEKECGSHGNTIAFRVLSCVFSQDFVSWHLNVNEHW